MTNSHKQHILQLAPEAEGKVFLLKEYSSGENLDIMDPFGGSIEIYRACFQELYQDIAKALEKWLKKPMKKLGVEIMKIALGSDHGGFQLKEEIKKFLDSKGLEYKDFGTNSSDSCDYPDIALPVAQAIKKGEYDRGILVCGTGIGIGIAANKIPGIRAALCHDTFSARASREHNNANILTMGERVIGKGLALDIVEVWLTTEFCGGRHQRRIDKISQIEKS